ncbi:hypothetical protein ABER61_02900 [Brevibacillus formosus]|uniref:Uncharacterized protein n=1 Tax=Brevibacillus formosus TaxID=54913 RepID=A0ABQ0T6D7_9BACL|nr:hypothetical protein [Brevibacillus formosus]MED1955186.1 hypothetical protein [Brevibacillus formosus]GED58432.1 hypothetical protein BFO01nite_25640 [Brevibacillus formosus]
MTTDSFQSALLAEAQRLQTLVNDDERLRTEFPRESRFIASTFQDREDEFRKLWQSRETAGRERLLLRSLPFYRAGFTHINDNPTWCSPVQERGVNRGQTRRNTPGGPETLQAYS